MNRRGFLGNVGKALAGIVAAPVVGRARMLGKQPTHTVELLTPDLELVADLTDYVYPLSLAGGMADDGTHRHTYEWPAGKEYSHALIELYVPGKGMHTHTYDKGAFFG